MRIIVDGSCGSGKTTFLTEIKNRIAIVEKTNE